MNLDSEESVKRHFLHAFHPHTIAWRPCILYIRYIMLFSFSSVVSVLEKFLVFISLQGLHFLINSISTNEVSNRGCLVLNLYRKNTFLVADLFSMFYESISFKPTHNKRKRKDNQRENFMYRSHMYFFPNYQLLSITSQTSARSLNKQIFHTSAHLFVVIH